MSFTTQKKSEIKFYKNVKENVYLVYSEFEITSKYNIIKLLQDTTTSQIFLIEDIKTKKQYAMKILNIQNLKKIYSLNQSEIIIQKNLESFKLISILNHYFPKLNAICAKEFYILKNNENKNINFYFIQDYYPEDIFEGLNSLHKKLKPSELIDFVSSIKETVLSYAKLGILLLDIKCENILINNENQLVFIDFDDCFVSKSFQELFELKWTQKKIFGTEQYMHPEYYSLINNCDIIKLEKSLTFQKAKKFTMWALGILQYEVFTRENLWDTPSYKNKNFKMFIQTMVLPHEEYLTLNQINYIHKNIKPLLTL